MTSKEINMNEIFAAVYLAGVENGLGRRIDDLAEIRHRKEGFIKGNPACYEATQATIRYFEKLIGDDEGMVDVNKVNLYTASRFNMIIKHRNQVREIIRDKVKRI